MSGIGADLLEDCSMHRSDFDTCTHVSKHLTSLYHS